jgi:chorismate lyase/3-hydroxybenzoate synthase
VEPGVSRRHTRGDNLALTSIRIDNALQMGARTFRAATSKAYELLSDACQQNPQKHLVRVWNFIPSILEPLGEFRQRYMVFNAGRFSAYEKKYGGQDRFPVAVATASGVGHQGQDLVIHGLGTDQPGKPVENPRQVPSYNYSKKFGFLPPCFSRGTLVSFSGGKRSTLLVGGTASIRGEKTMYEEDLETQASETLLNLNALVASGCGQPFDPDSIQRGELNHLHRFRHLRVYFRDSPPPKNAVDSLLGQFPGLESLEIAQADLCRPGLVIEIEGAADVTV